MSTTDLRHKICHCRPDCNSLLGPQQRRNHYRWLDDISSLRRSTTPEGSHSAVENDNEDPNDGFELEDIPMDQDGPAYDDGEDYPMDEEAHSGEDSSEEDDHGQEGGDGFYEGDDAEGEWEFGGELEAEEQHLSLAEISEAIEDAMGPEMDVEMYNLSE